jgi:hypothetical protein
MPLPSEISVDPVLTPLLTSAFDLAWKTVEQAGVDVDLDGRKAAIREAIAKRIVTMASEGVTNAQDLAVDALAHTWSGGITSPP